VERNLECDPFLLWIAELECDPKKTDQSQACKRVVNSDQNGKRKKIMKLAKLYMLNETYNAVEKYHGKDDEALRQKSFCSSYSIVSPLFQ
jgi:hypothetical protein